MIVAQERCVQLLQKYCSHRLSEKMIQQLVQESWEYCKGHGLFEESETGSAKVFCLMLPTYARGAIFCQIDDDELRRVLFYDISKNIIDERHWTPEIFSLFPNLRDRLEELSSVSKIGWESPALEYVGPENIDEDAIRKMVCDAYTVYTDRPYHQSAFGFKDNVWIEMITSQILSAYYVGRNAGKVIEVSDDLFVCHVGITNVNREIMYLIIGLQNEPYLLSPSRRIPIDFPDIKGSLTDAIYRCNPGDRKGYPLLSSWGFYYSNQFQTLKEELLYERWCFANEENTDENQLKAIQKYIENSFVRLLWEDEVLLVDIHKRKANNLEDAKWAVFNTGLVNKSYQPLYAVFRRNAQRNDTDPIWRLDCFEVVGHGAMNGIINPPKRANYFKTMQDMFYDLKGVPNSKDPDIDVDHALIDNLDRLPEIAQKKFLGKDYNNYISADYRQRKVIRENRPSTSKNNLETLFRSAVKKSISRAECNYRTGVPMYYIREGEMTILLPVALAHEFEMQDDWESETTELKCDLALAMQLLNNDDEKKYIAKTIFKLDMAYRDARLVARPGSDWLAAELIESSDDDIE